MTPRQLLEPRLLQDCVEFYNEVVQNASKYLKKGKQFYAVTFGGGCSFERQISRGGASRSGGLSTHAGL